VPAPKGSGEGAASPVQRPAQPERPAAATSPARGLRWRYLGAAHRDYALFETPGGLVCLNRRAAQVRVLYEEFLQTLRDGSVLAQTLLFPCTFELPPLLADTLEQHVEFFQQNGFAVEPFGRHTFRIGSVPAWFDGDQCEAFVRDVAALIHERGMRPRQEAGLARQVLARMAAMRSARVDSAAGEHEMQALVQRLLACENPLADPQGRPTYFELTRAELERRFGAS
jgi:DNA mismatch repair protein MutL